MSEEETLPDPPLPPSDEKEDVTEGSTAVDDEIVEEEESSKDDGVPDTVSSVTEPISDELLQEDFISNQTNEKDNSFYKALLAGFKSLKQARETKKTPLFSADSMDDDEAGVSESATMTSKSVPMHVTVNFVDPTTKPPGAPIMSPKANNLLSKSRLSAPSIAPYTIIENVFEKLNHIFQKDYGSTLRSVQYRNMRSGESDVISSIPVEMILTRTGNASGTGEAANVAWGGMAGSSALTDPSEWHNGPFCHVYIAAVESMDHYRTKVRPSLQAFVSQLELSSGPSSKSTTSSVLGSPAGTAASGSNSGAPFLIVYVPTGGGAARKNTASNGTSNEDTSVHSGPVRRALASQFAKARERIANYQTDSMDNGSVHSKDSLGSGDVDLVDDDPDAAAAALTLQSLSPNEKLLYKKLVKDFSSGKVCVMSKSSLDKMDEQDNTILTADSTVMATRTQEWNSFNRMLGAVIVNGFNDRCRRYNEELRRLDAQRAMAAQAAKGHTKPPERTASGSIFGVSLSSSSNAKPAAPAAFNLGYFFLVKESLAFTYEQMQLPSEALLQYDEFSAFLPDLTFEEHKKALKLRRKSKALKDDLGVPLVELADAADFVGFRKRLRTEFDLTPILEIMRRYLFAREIRLLFKMEQPVEVISRCEAFSKHMYSVMQRGLLECSEQVRKQRETDAAKWVVQFTWDVKSSCEVYLVPDGPSRESSFGDTLSVDTPGSDLTNESGNGSQSDQHVASRLGEILETARLLLKELGDAEFTGGNPLRKYEQSLPEDMFQAWEPWTAPNNPGRDSKANILKFVRESKTTDRQFLLQDAFLPVEAFEQTYLDIAGAIINLSRYGHRRRLAFRLQGELGEHLVRKGDLKAAAAVFKNTVKVYRTDQWDRCHFWRLFRLAFCQRTTAMPTDYLKTLATCFSPRIAFVAPIKALQALQSDIEKVIENPSIGESKYGTIAFLETSMEVLETASDESTMGTGVDRKQVLKRFCSVGETVCINITITCHLPREIQLDSLKLFIVEFAAFSSIIENRESVEEDDAAKTIGLEGGVKLLPGKNTFKFEWAPSTAGQFILSTLEVVWKQGFFYYDSMELPAPLLGVDVLPSEPAHSLKLEPAYLVPGHDQEVRITFDAGSDLVTTGSIQMSCSEGITMIGPGEDLTSGQWKKDCEIALLPCKPGEKMVLTAHIRCALIDTFSHSSISQTPSFDTAHGLSVKAFTKYLHADAEGADHSSTQTMKTVLEAFAPILEKAALWVESVEPLWLIPGERVMISINLVSNTPDHFLVVDLGLLVPPPLKLDTGVDHNADLLQSAVSDEDQLCLSYECIIGSKSESSSIEEPVLHVKLCDDNKKEFSLDLPLGLDEFYLELLENQSLNKPTAEAKAALNLSSHEGQMGEPVKLTFTVETQAEGDIVFTVDADGSDWLVSGKVNGSMQRSGFMSLGFMGSCEVVGIPAVAGVLTTFPKLQLGIASLKGGYTPLKMNFTAPESFRSVSRNTAMGVAFPMNKVAI